MSGLSLPKRFIASIHGKRSYLVPVKVGNKNMYARSDVRRVQTGGKSESVTSYCKKKNG